MADRGLKDHAADSGGKNDQRQRGRGSFGEALRRKKRNAAIDRRKRKADQHHRGNLQRSARKERQKQAAQRRKRKIVRHHQRRRFNKTAQYAPEDAGKPVSRERKRAELAYALTGKVAADPVGYGGFRADKDDHDQHVEQHVGTFGKMQNGCALLLLLRLRLSDAAHEQPVKRKA